MASSEYQSKLVVEGTDDRHAIKNLLIHRGVQYDNEPLPEKIPIIESKEGKDELLRGVEQAVRFSSNLSVGFVLDANSSPNDTWKAIGSQLGKTGMTVPNKIPLDGFVDDAQQFAARVGVWIMPDNQSSGSQENFLTTLIDKGDQLLPLAKKSTAEARKLGASFPDAAENKAKICTWLAWQYKPGLPYGTAVRANYFRGASPAAESFFTWYCRLFQISKP